MCFLKYHLVIIYLPVFPSLGKYHLLKVRSKIYWKWGLIFHVLFVEKFKQNKNRSKAYSAFVFNNDRWIGNRLLSKLILSDLASPNHLKGIEPFYHQKYFFFVFVHTCLCVVYVHVCSYVCACACVCSCVSEDLGILECYPRECPPPLLEPGLVSSSLTPHDWLASKFQGPMSSPSCWNSSCTLPCLAFYRQSGAQTQVLMLGKQALYLPTELFSSPWICSISNR